ncbi:hypothetical protein [Micromonospora sp. NPDC005806]|uniref:hypothetical protein n=1 Tax=Micromonospora sp. NPDC005806 TaxID=3364234 RepID=UPI0036BE2EFD
MTQRQKQNRAQVPSQREELEQESSRRESRSVIASIETLKPYLELLGIAAVLAVPLSAFRILVVADYNQTVALAIVANSGGADLAVALLVLAIPTALYLLAMGLAAEVGSAGCRDRPPKVIFLLVVVSYITLTAVHWFDLALYALLPLAIAAWFYFADRTKSQEESRDENKRFLKGIVLSTLLISLTSSSMWLAPERLVVDGTPKRGYVLKSEDNEIAVFFEDKNAVLRLPKEKVKDRQYCSPSSGNPLHRTTSKALPRCPR